MVVAQHLNHSVLFVSLLDVDSAIVGSLLVK